MKPIGALLGMGVLLLAGGCPVAELLSGQDGPVTAVISFTATEGDAPLAVSLSALQSTSRNGGLLAFAWDLGDGTTSTDAVVDHTYAAPGLYRVILRVTDESGATGADSIDIRVRGGSAIAIISATPTSGPQPLTVQFNATLSVVTGDTIRDYYWDFGDGSTSREAQPVHTFTADGQFRVNLRIVTAGGTEASTFTTITVGERNGSLSFNGGSRAVLPFANPDGWPEVTVEAWVKLEPTGGNVFTFGGGALALDLLPSSNTVRLRLHGEERVGSYGGLTSTWRHFAVVYDGPAPASPGGTAETSGLCTLYIDNAIVLTQAVDRVVEGETLMVGAGMEGNVAEVRLWQVARTAEQIYAARTQRQSGSAAGLVGVWPLDEGTGQTLKNLVTSGAAGYRGSTTAEDALDPDWSADGPPL